MSYNKYPGPQKTLAKLPLWQTVLGLIGLLVVVNYEQIFTRHSLETRVVYSDLSEACVSHEAGFRFRYSRSSKPGFSSLYCGEIITENGPFRVIEDGMFVIGAESRSALVSKLQPDCRVKIYYYGLGSPEPMPGIYSSNEIRYWIYAVEPIDGC